MFPLNKPCVVKPLDNGKYLLSFRSPDPVFFFFLPPNICQCDAMRSTRVDNPIFIGGCWPRFQTKTTLLLLLLLLSGDAYDNLIKKSASEENRNPRYIFSNDSILERTIFIIKICIQFCAPAYQTFFSLVYNPIPMLSQVSSRIRVHSPLASTLLARLSLFILYRCI